MYPSGLVLVEQIVALKQQVIAYEQIVGRVRVALISGDLDLARYEVRDVVVVYGLDGPVGVLPNTQTKGETS